MTNTSRLSRHPSLFLQGFYTLLLYTTICGSDPPHSSFLLHASQQSDPQIADIPLPPLIESILGTWNSAAYTNPYDTKLYKIIFLFQYVFMFVVIFVHN